MYPDLKDKTALVTGSGKRTGIGYAIARKLAENGTNVIIADVGRQGGHEDQVARGTTEEMEAIARNLRHKFGVRALSLSVDVTQNSSIDRMVDDLKNHFDHIVHEYGNYMNLMLVVMKRMSDIRKKKKIEKPDRFLISGLFSKNGKGGYLWETTEAEEETAGNYAKEYLRQLDQSGMNNLNSGGNDDL